MSRGRKAQQDNGGRRGRRRDPGAPVRSPRGPVGAYGDRAQRVIYIAHEGEKTEKDYLQLLERTYRTRDGKPTFRFALLGEAGGLRPMATVDRVLEQAGPHDEKWVFFDRDAADSRDTEIPQAMRKAAKNGVQVVLSHPSFELWLLLHFQLWTSQESGLDSKVKDRLRQHKDAKGFEDYDRASGDRGKGIDGQRAESLLGPGRVKNAIRNARKLVNACQYGQCKAKDADEIAATNPVPNKPETYEEWTRRSGHAGGCDPLKRDPSTDVWRLLAALEIDGEDE
ncbi:RloB family protein [Streptomyces sp. NBS 14/10]|uniref:RloB family protein n=1 Tax=Streptomyces sp. NBS 14/10 TaxID=1945643 RepID=UPI000B7E98F2|nr:RloB family protein [Streptomyces sp. NBS 14/10]KAK1182332.1 RloB family protein [Streptomyces sp. NBS 14/10]